MAPNNRTTNSLRSHPSSNCMVEWLHRMRQCARLVRSHQIGPVDQIEHHHHRIRQRRRRRPRWLCLDNGRTNIVRLQTMVRDRVDALLVGIKTLVQMFRIGDESRSSNPSSLSMIQPLMFPLAAAILSNPKCNLQSSNSSNNISHSNRSSLLTTTSRTHHKHLRH